MTKYLLGILSALASLIIGTAFADNYSLQVLNLPLVQAANKTFTFNMSVSSSFSGTPQPATLYVDDCGKDLMVAYQSRVRSSIPLTLSPNGKQEFPLTIYRDTNEECVLSFRLLDENATLLASTKVGLVPQCPSQRNKAPIDEGLDYTLPEIASQSQSSTPVVNQTSPSASSPSTSSSQPSSASPSSASNQVSSPSQTEKNQKEPLVTYTDDELDAAFNLLVEKGILTAEDKAKLQQPLTRMDAARLFVNIALANDLPRDTNKFCIFPDLRDSSDEDTNIAKLACQFNIMGVNPNYTQLDNFMPSMVIPSEQLVTAFSRLMWRDLYEQPDHAAYYELHMNTMYNLGLVDAKVTNADQKRADFAIIAARALDKEQLTINETSPAKPENEKKRYQFW